MVASDEPDGSNRRKSPPKMAMCARAGETHFRAIDPTHVTTKPCHVHSVFLSTVPAFWGFSSWLSRLIWSHLPPLQSLQGTPRAQTRWQNSQPWSSGTGCLEKMGDIDQSTWEGPWLAKFRMGMPEGEACNDSCWFVNWSSCQGRMGCVLTRTVRGDFQVDLSN